jgi:hypothetical protein
MRFGRSHDEEALALKLPASPAEAHGIELGF